MLLLAGLCHCNNGGDGAKDKKVFAAGDRAGADTSMTDLGHSTAGPDLICQRWDNKEDAEDAKVISSLMDMPFRGFYLFKDGSLVKDPRDNMSFGSWSWDDKEYMLTVIPANGMPEEYMLNTLHDTSAVMKKITMDHPVDYIADGFVHKEVMNDPFYPANMQWRVRPKAAEDDAALHKRVKACLHFYYLFFSDAYKRNSRYIEFRGLPTCFTWYEGGIHLMKEEKLDKRWRDIFYNAADASKAYIILDKMISKKYNWDKEEKRWVKQNAGVLQQMEAAIDSL